MMGFGVKASLWEKVYIQELDLKVCSYRLGNIIRSFAISAESPYQSEIIDRADILCFI